MEDKDNISLFDRYHENELNEEDRLAFEMRKEKDASFRRDFESYLNTIASIQEYKRKELKTLINKNSAYLNKKAKVPTEPIRRRFLRRWQSLAAVFLCLIAIYSVFQFSNFNNHLLNNYMFDPISDNYLSPIERQNSFTQSKRSFNEGYRHLNAKDYPAALDASFTQSKRSFNEGYRHLNAKDCPAALDAFRKVSSSYFELYYLAQYFTALAYIGEDDRDAARRVLVALTDQPETHFMDSRVRRLLADLDRNWFFYF